MMSFEKFLEKLDKEEKATSAIMTFNRFRELAGLQESNLSNRYAIQIIVEVDNELLLEHEQYQKFKKSTDLYSYHPENPSIPVLGHYHIVDAKSKKEIYAVNMDGTAHHRKNKGYEVPKRQAEELRSLDVKIPPNNILESKQFTLNEALTNHSFSFFIILES